MFRARKAAWFLSLLITAASVMAACGPRGGANQPAPPGGATAPPAAAGKPAVGGEINLRLAQNPDNFNPILSFTVYGSMVNDLVYASLFEFNEKWEPTPYVAKSWDASEDGLTWTINLRDDVKFHDGSPLTAEDVVFTISTIMDPNYKGPRKSSVTAIKAIRALNPTTVEITLNQPFAPLLQNINYGILQKKLFAGTPVADLATHPNTMDKPIGAGPYVFKEFKKSQYLMLERNPDWFFSKERNGAPFIQTVRFKVIPDDQTALSALENGELDLQTPDPKEVERLTQNANLTPVHYERNGWGYLVLNNARPPLNDKLVRQALTYGLDRNAIITGVMDGRAVIPPGPIPPVSWAADPALKPTPYDPAKAKQLLEQAGYKMGAGGFYEKGGKPLKLQFYATSGIPLIEGIATIAKRNWKDIGVDMDIQLMEFNAMSDNYLKPGKFDVGFAGFSLGLDPDQYSLFHSSQGKPDERGIVLAGNRMRYSNPRVDELLEAGRRETDPNKRKQIYSDYQKILVDDAPVILVYANKYTDFVSKKVKGGVVNFPGAGATPSLLYRWWINQS